MTAQRTPSRRERLVDELAATAIDLQALAQRCANAKDIPGAVRTYAEQVAQAGRVVALAAVAANRGRHPQELTLFYGQYLETNEQLRDKRPALAEAGFIPKANPEHTAEALHPRRAAAATVTP